MRGFEPAGIGPRDSVTKDSLGGNLYNFNTVQTEFPIGLPSELNIKGSLFLDIGTVTKVDKQNHTILDSGKFRLSIGAGVSWKSPMGPIRVDLGFPIIKEEYDNVTLIRFSVGNFL